MARVVSVPHLQDNVSPRATNTSAGQDQSTVQSAFPQTKQRVLETFTPTGQYTDVATEDYEIITALKLVASSVAEQRQIAAKQLIFHPLVLGLLVVILAWSIRAIYHDLSDWLSILVTCAGVISAILGLIKRFVDGYIDEAERVGTLNWLYGHDPIRDISGAAEPRDPIFNTDNGHTFVLVHRFKRQIVGALVMSIVCCETEPQSDIIKGTLPEDYSTFIRAWTVQQAFRGYGIGSELLNEAIKISYEKKWQVPRFAICHANSARMLYPTFHRDMDYTSTTWISYLRKRIEAHRQSCVKWETRAIEASRNTTNDQDPMIDIKVLLARMKMKLDVLLRNYLNVSLEKAMDAQARWKETL